MGQLELGRLCMHEMCITTQETGHAHIKGQVLEHGYMECGTSPGQWADLSLAESSELIQDRT